MNARVKWLIYSSDLKQDRKTCLDFSSGVMQLMTMIHHYEMIPRRLRNGSKVVKDFATKITLKKSFCRIEGYNLWIRYLSKIISLTVL